MTHTSKSWIKRLSHCAKEALEIPMWGNPPEFPLEALQNELRETLQLSDLSLSIGSADWKQSEDLLSGLGNNPMSVCFDVSPFGESFFWVMPFEEISKITSWCLSGEEENFEDHELRKGFYRYILTQTLGAQSRVQALGDLSLKIAEGALPSEESYCIDVSLTYQGSTAWGRVICPASFQRGFKEYFVIGKSPLYSPLSPHVDLNLAISMGASHISYDEFSMAKEGDFLVLDHYSYFPESKRGTFTLTLDHHPLFQLKLKDDKIKILDFAHYFEDHNMDEETPENPPPEMEGHEIPPQIEENSEEPEVAEEQQPEAEEEEETYAEEVTEAPKEELSPPLHVPLKISVEVTRLKMSLEKLLQLKPGNVLELAVRPEQGVDLTLEGKVIARGQLLQIGEVVGVKITDLTS